MGFFLPSLDRARGPHPDLAEPVIGPARAGPVGSATLPENGEGFVYSAATTRFPFAGRRASTGAKNCPV